MSRQRLHELIDSLSEAQVPAAMAFLSELGDEETVDAPTAAKLDAALTEPGHNITLEDLNQRCERNTECARVEP